MPRVPTTTGPEVLPSVVSPAFQSGAGATVEAFGTGRGLLAVGEGISQTSDLLSARILEEQAKDNERYAKQLDTEFQTRIRTILYGDGSEENPGFTSQLGENAIQSRADVQKAIEAAHRELLQQANQNPRVRDMFGVSSGVRINDALTQIARHTSEQRQVANEAATLARIELTQSEIQSSNGDPEIMAKNLALMSIEVQELAEQRGLGEEAVAQMMQEAQSKALAPMIEQVMIDDPVRAEALYHANKQLIDGDTRVAIETKLAEANLYTFAQELAAEAAAAHPGDVKAQLAYIDANSDGKQQAAAEERAESLWRLDRAMIGEAREDIRWSWAQEDRYVADQAATNAWEAAHPGETTDPANARIWMAAREEALRQDQIEQQQRELVTDEALDRAYAFIDNGGTVGAFATSNPTDYALLVTEGKLEDIRQREDANAPGRDGFARTSDPNVVNAYRFMSTQDLANVDPNRDKQNLSAQDFAMISGWVKGAQDQIAAEGAGSEAYTTGRSLLKDFTPELKWDATGTNAPGKDEVRIQQALTNQMNAFISNYTATYGKAPGYPELQQEAVRLTLKQPTGDWWSRNFKRDQYIGELEYGDVIVAREDITPEMETRISGAIEIAIESGSLTQEQVTDQLYEELAGAFLSGNYDRAIQLLSGEQ